MSPPSAKRGLTSLAAGQRGEALFLFKGSTPESPKAVKRGGCHARCAVVSHSRSSDSDCLAQRTSTAVAAAATRMRAVFRMSVSEDGSSADEIFDGAGDLEDPQYRGARIDDPYMR